MRQTFHRLLCGLIGMAAMGAVGWIAARLTVGLVLARHFDAGTHRQLESLWLAGCLIGGFLAGILFDRRWLNEQLRWICWGAVISLATLAALRVVLDHQLPISKVAGLRIFGMDFSWDEAALLSAPAALLAGGFLGWFFHRYCLRNRSCELASDRRGES